MNWTDDRIGILKNGWASGLSASQIASRLGDVTRNAVIGKVHRLGLARRAESKRERMDRESRQINLPLPPSRKQDRNNLAWLRNEPKRSQTAAKPVLAVVKTIKPKIDRDGAPESLGMALLDLRANACKWPHGHPGDSGFGFCGHATTSGASYCPYHTAVGTTQPHVRQKMAG